MHTHVHTLVLLALGFRVYLPTGVCSILHSSCIIDIPYSITVLAIMIINHYAVFIVKIISNNSLILFQTSERNVCLQRQNVSEPYKRINVIAIITFGFLLTRTVGWGMICWSTLRSLHLLPSASGSDRGSGCERPPGRKGRSVCIEISDTL